MNWCVRNKKSSRVDCGIQSLSRRCSHLGKHPCYERALSCDRQAMAGQEINKVDDSNPSVELALGKCQVADLCCRKQCVVDILHQHLNGCENRVVAEIQKEAQQE